MPNPKTEKSSSIWKVKLARQAGTMTNAAKNPEIGQ